MRFRPVPSLLLALAVLLLFAAGCGGDEDPTADEFVSTAEESGSDGGGGAATTISMSEYAFDPSDPTVSSGDTIEVTNDGEIPHNFTADEIGLRTADLASGDSQELVVEAAAGDYEFTCTIADHAAQGMTGTLTVE